jgi:hypothetical protein
MDSSVIDQAESWWRRSGSEPGAVATGSCTQFESSTRSLPLPVLIEFAKLQICLPEAR